MISSVYVSKVPREMREVNATGGAPVDIKSYMADRLQFYSLFTFSLDFMWLSSLLQIRRKETSAVNKAEKNKETLRNMSTTHSSMFSFIAFSHK